MATALSGRQSHLPDYLTPFIGRQQEVADIHRLLASRRLLTLTGPGGAGKTRLALAVAAGLEETFPDGIWLVELAELSEPTLIPQAVAAALSLREMPEQSLAEALVNFLYGRHALLLLDNCEHLLDACARLAADLLQACPDLHLLVTSREALGLPGEIVRPMLPLALPQPDAAADLAALADVEAIALFLDRAAALAPDFALTETNATAVVQICHLLDGMPLAIELAAARVPVLSVAQIAARLQDNLRLLAAGPRLAQPRHRTMRAAIEWSYALLSEPEQTLWRRLSVFRGNFSLDAVEAVGSDKVTGVQFSTPSSLHPLTVSPHQFIDLLTQLVQKSLVIVIRGQREARYRLLEPLRQYAAEKLEEAGETNPIRQNHCEYYLAWAEQHESKLRGPEQLAWLDEFAACYPNLRAALAWSLEAPPNTEMGLHLAVAITSFWFLRNMFTEGRRWLQELLARSGAETAALIRGQALFCAATLAWYLSDYPAARRDVEESYTIARSLPQEGKWGMAYILMGLGQTMRFQGEEPAALQYLTESVALFRRNGDRWGLALALDSLGSVCRQVGDRAAAYAAFQESQGLWRALGDAWGMALNQMEFFMQALAAEDEAAAQAIYDEQGATLEALGLSWHLGNLYQGMGNVALRRGEYTAAVARYGRSLELARQIGDTLKEAAALMALSAATLGLDQAAQAARHGREGLLLYEQYQKPEPAAFQLERMADVAERTGQRELSGRLQAAAAALRQVIDPPRDSPVNGTAVFADALAELQRLATAEVVASEKAATVLPFDLTARELEVLRLAAKGLTDPQIAARLVLSKRTVSAHLQTVYSKLGVNSRTAATRLALEHQLLD